MNKEIIDISFARLLEQFPTVELPITLGEQSHLDFSKHNEPLPYPVILKFLQPVEVTEDDEYTEYIACFKIPETYDFHALVYWKAELLNYTYTLVTFSKQGELIDKRVIAGTFSDGETITHSVATIDDDWMIYILSGQNKSNANYDPTSSKKVDLELLPDGLIVQSS